MTDLAADFKSAMRQLVATVTIVTNRDATGRRSGMTATAVTSLSADPPALLVCVNRSASMHATLAADSLFCVNLLGEPHAELARSFGGKTEPEFRFDAGAWDADANDVPFLTDAVATLFCRVDRIVDYATHSIVIGRVCEAVVQPARRTLIYGNGKFALMAET